MNGMNTHIQSSIFQSRVKGGTIKAASDVNKNLQVLYRKGRGNGIVREDDKLHRWMV